MADLEKYIRTWKLKGHCGLYKTRETKFWEPGNRPELTKPPLRGLRQVAQNPSPRVDYAEAYAGDLITLNCLPCLFYGLCQPKPEVATLDGLPHASVRPEKQAVSNSAIKKVIKEQRQEEQGW